MKNVFLALAFMLIGLSSFASTNIESNIDMNSENATELLSTEFNNSLMIAKGFTSDKSVVDFGELGCLVEVTIYVNGEYWGSFSTWHADGCGAALRSASDILDQLGF